MEEAVLADRSPMKGYRLTNRVFVIRPVGDGCDFRPPQTDYAVAYRLRVRVAVGGGARIHRGCFVPSFRPEHMQVVQAKSMISYSCNPN